MAAWVFSIIDRLGTAGVGLLILLENLVPPIPSEVILPLAGFRAKVGALNVWLVWPSATAGSVTGALVLYGLGRWLGYDRLYRLAGHTWFILASQGDIDRGERLFRDYGGKIVLFARMVPIIRSIVSVPAGVAEMPIPRFVLLTAIGSGIWNALFIGLGWYLGSNYAVIGGWLGPVSYVVLGMVVVGLVWLVVRRLRSRDPHLSTKPPC
ncbi:MAG: DedA family protein [Pseudonocardiaceae bacterium]